MRYELEENGRLIQFVYNADREVITEETKEDTKRYFRGYTLISSDSEKAKTYYHYASDELGSITHVLGRKEESDSLEVLNHYTYDAFGNVIECEENIENRFRFAGEQYDQITGQYYLRARFYNPVIGRFTQEDTYYGDGLNLYAYCDNNPVRYVDPSGYGKQDPNQKQRKRRESDWDRFRKENKGKYTREEMSAAYKKYKAEQAAKQKNKPKAKKPSSKKSQGNKNGETDATAIGKAVHKRKADERRASGEYDSVNERMKDSNGNDIKVPKTVNKKTKVASEETQSVMPDAVKGPDKGGIIIDDKPAGRPISKDYQEIRRFVEAYEKKYGVLPKKIIIERYDPDTGEHVDTESYSPSMFKN